MTGIKKRLDINLSSNGATGAIIRKLLSSLQGSQMQQRRLDSNPAGREGETVVSAEMAKVRVKPSALSHIDN
jgi:hypothetical protein